MSNEHPAPRRDLGASLRPLRASGRFLQGQALALLAEARWRAAALRPLEGWRENPLGAPLVVSLTSRPPRFPVLALTLKTLLTQTVRPDRILLWLTPEEHSQLPGDIRALRGLTIKHAPAIGCYKKIVPTLERWPDAFIAIADDDAYYPSTWLEHLTSAYDPRRREVPCHVAYRIKRNRAGAASFARWSLYRRPAASPLTLAAGRGGVLYPPHSLHADVTNAHLFTRLAPTSDDLWLYWMAHRAGFRFCKIGSRRDVAGWLGPQHPAREHDHNDVQCAALMQHFGWPRAERQSASSYATHSFQTHHDASLRAQM